MIDTHNYSDCWLNGTTADNQYRSYRSYFFQRNLHPQITVKENPSHCIPPSHTSPTILFVLFKILLYKVKESCDRPRWSKGFRLGPAFSRLSALKGWYFVSRTHRPSLPQEKFLVHIFRGWFNPSAHGCFGGTTEKIRSDITVTFRLVAQCLNHYATRGLLMCTAPHFSLIWSFLNNTFNCFNQFLWYEIS